MCLIAYVKWDFGGVILFLLVLAGKNAQKCDRMGIRDAIGDESVFLVGNFVSVKMSREKCTKVRFRGD